MKRRTFLTNLSAAAVGAELTGSKVAIAARDDTKPTFVFVHGAWFGGWCWAEVVRLLARQGYDGVTVDLPGHGLSAQFPTAYTVTPQDTAGLTTEVSPLAAVTLSDYRDHVLSAIDGLVKNGSGPVILVGHSLGGVTLNVVAEAQPKLIKRLVYLTAFAPIVKPTVLEYLSQPNFVASKLLPLFLGDPTQLGAARINPNSGDPAYAASVKNALYLDLNDKVIGATSNMLTPDEPLHGLLDLATVTAEHWGSVPRSFIRCTNDQAIPLAGQNQMIAEGDKLTPRNPFMLKTLESSHSAFLAHPQEVARVLLEMV